MKSFWITLVALVVAAPLALGLVAGMTYYTTSEDNIPRPAVVVLEQKVRPAGHNWQEPVFGGMMYRDFEKQPEGAAESLGTITQPQLGLELPEGYTATVRVTQAGTQVFSGTAAQFAEHAFLDNGAYVVDLACERQRQDNQGYGTFYYRFAFNVEVEPHLQTDNAWTAQGDVAVIRLTQLGGDALPTATTSLGDVRFMPAGTGTAVAFVPVGCDTEPGGYTVKVQAGAYQWEVQLRVLETRFPGSERAEVIEGWPNDEYEAAITPLYQKFDEEKYWDGPFLMPAAGDLAAPYGALLQLSARYSAKHTGINILAREGDAVVAPAAGRVVFADYLSASGNTVVIEHGYGLKSVLQHLDTLLVREGEMLKSGQQVGTVGSSGNTQVTHLHFEVRLGDVPIDPAALVSGTSPISRYA